MVSALAAVLVVGVVAGCSSAVGSAPTSTEPSAASRPTTTPARDPLSMVDTIVIGGDGLHLRRGETDVAVLDYRGNAQDALDALTAALGAPDEVTEFAGTNHTDPATQNRFGALSISVEHYSGPVTPDYVTTPTWTAKASGPSAGDVALRTAGGLRVGDPYAVAHGIVDGQGTLDRGDGTFTAWVLVDVSPGSPTTLADPDHIPTGVLVGAEDDAGAITWISAPAPMAGP